MSAFHRLPSTKSNAYGFVELLGNPLPGVVYQTPAPVTLNPAVVSGKSWEFLLQENTSETDHGNSKYDPLPANAGTQYVPFNIVQALPNAAESSSGSTNGSKSLKGSPMSWSSLQSFSSPSFSRSLSRLSSDDSHSSGNSTFVGGFTPKSFGHPNTALGSIHTSRGFTLSTEADKKKQNDDRRKLKNRERVRRCRKRKQDQMNDLETKNQILERENANLRLHLSSLENPEFNDAEQKSMNETHMNVLEKLVAAMATDDISVLEREAAEIWNENATITQDNNALVYDGLEEIVAFHRGLRHALENLLITDYSIQHEAEISRKARINWKIEGVVNKNFDLSSLFDNMSYKSVAKINILAKLWKQLEGQALKISGFSHVTFVSGKIQHDLRLIDYFSLMNELQQLLPNFDLMEFFQAFCSSKY